MATTRIVIDDPVGAVSLPATAFPQILRRQGTNFPVPGLAFDAAAAEAAFFRWKAVAYGSGNVTLTLRWYGDTAITGDVIWGAQLAAITPDTDTQDVETDALATANTVTDTHLGTTAHRIMTCAITVSNLDSLAANDEVFMRIYRDAAAAGDTMAGDAILVGLEISYSDT